MQVNTITCSVSGRAWRVTQVLVPRWRARHRRRSHLSPEPACTAAQHYRTSSTEHKHLPAGAESELHWDGPDPELSPLSQGIFVKGPLPKQTDRENQIYM